SCALPDGGGVLSIPHSVSRLQPGAISGAGGGAGDAGNHEQEQRNCSYQGQRLKPVSRCNAAAVRRACAGSNVAAARRHVLAVLQPEAGRAPQPDQGAAAANVCAPAALDFWREFENLQLRRIRSREQLVWRAQRVGTGSLRFPLAAADFCRKGPLGGRTTSVDVGERLISRFFIWFGG